MGDVFDQASSGDVFDQAAAHLPPTATISARESGLSHPLNYLEDVMGDIRHGSGTTFPGRVLRKTGAPGIDTGVPESVGEVMGGPLIGPVKVAHGVGTAVSGHPVRGINEAVEGAGQTVAPLIGATNPEFLPSLALYGSLQHGVQKGTESLGADPDTAEMIGNVATVAVPSLHAATPRVSRYVASKAEPIGKVLGYGGAVATAGEELYHGRPIHALEAAATAPFAAKGISKSISTVAPAVGRMAEATPLPNPIGHGLPAISSDTLPPRELPAGRYAASPSTKPAPKQLTSGVIDGEYVTEPIAKPQPAKATLPRGVYQQPGGFEPNQPALPERGTAIALPSDFPAPRKPIIRTTETAPKQLSAAPIAKPAPPPKPIGDLLNEGLGGKALKPNVPLRDQLSNSPTKIGVAPGYTPIDSSAIKSYKYDPTTKEFETVTSTGAVYVHGDVSPEQVKAFEQADSKGKAWNDIKKNSTYLGKVVNGKKVYAQPPMDIRSASPSDLTDQLSKSVKIAKQKRGAIQ
jgi:hypothetical protein